MKPTVFNTQITSSLITSTITDIFKVGVGPSSSHTLGPWKAALCFLENIFNLVGKYEVKNINVQNLQIQLKIHLYGSLALTGIGHGTDLAVIWGLLNIGLTQKNL